LNKIVSIKDTNAIFLAIVLIVGTITLSSPSSFMKDVQAQRDYYGMDNNYKNNYEKDNNSYYKSKDNQIIKKINCNNIYVNVNGLEIDGLPSALSGLAASETDEGERDVNFYEIYGGNGEQQSGYDNKNSFKFVCINNNNNTVIGGGEEEQPELPDLACEECFAANSTLQTAIEDLLAGFDELGSVIIFGILTTDGVNQIGDSITFAPQIDTIEELCSQIENAPISLSAPLSDELIRLAFSNLLGEDFEAGIEELIECLLEAGIIVDREEIEFPGGLNDELSTSGTVQCTGNPICARIT
jgi:hypothetical protein